MKTLEKVWSSLKDLINSRSEELKDRQRYSEKYSEMKAKIVDKLNSWEQTLSASSSLPIDPTELERQSESIDSFINDWNLCKDDINEFCMTGSEYDSILQGFPLGGDQNARITSPQRRPSSNDFGPLDIFNALLLNCLFLWSFYTF